MSRATHSRPARGLVPWSKGTCGWTRGAILGVPGADFTVANVTLNSVGCYIRDVDLGDHGTNLKIPDTAIDPASAPKMRLRDNFGSTQASAVALGTRTDAPLSVSTNGTITVGSSYVRVTATAGTPPPSLAKISGGTAGDVLVLTANVALTVNSVAGPTGNIRLVGGSVSLNDTKDTLTLICDGTNWLELAASDN